MQVYTLSDIPTYIPEYILDIKSNGCIDYIFDV